MTKWKTKGVTAIISMHAHNQWSRWYDYLMQAAEDLGLIVCAREDANHWDGSLDREWLVSDHMLTRVGGINALHELANKLRKEDDKAREIAFAEWA